MYEFLLYPLCAIPFWMVLSDYLLKQRDEYLSEDELRSRHKRQVILMHIFIWGILALVLHKKHGGFSEFFHQ
jgi:hypothetical protein